MAKKLINPLLFSEHFNTSLLALNYCIARTNCSRCPMLMRKLSGDLKCCLPSYLDSGSDSKTALNMLSADFDKRMNEARIRQRVLFDETK